MSQQVNPIPPPQKPLAEARDKDQKVTISRTLLRRLLADHDFFAAFARANVVVMEQYPQDLDAHDRAHAAAVKLRHGRCLGVETAIRDEAGISDDEDLDD